MKERIIKKLDHLIEEAQTLLDDFGRHDHAFNEKSKAIKDAEYSVFKTGALSFLKSLLGEDGLYYKRFYNGTTYYGDYALNLAIGLLTKVKQDIDEGWLTDVKGIVSAELFTDFLDMAEYLLEEHYKDPAAVIIGSVLEENLRQLSLKNGLSISIQDAKTGKLKILRAEALNTELTKNNIYNLTNQKSITAWLDLRNNAAHGHYSQYDIHMVRAFLQYVRDFAAKFF